MTPYDRNHGEPSKNEFTVAKVDAYNGIKKYLSELSDTNIRTVEDIIAYNVENRGTEGAFPGDHPAFPSGQVGALILGEYMLNNQRTFLNRLREQPARRIAPILTLSTIYSKRVEKKV